MVAKIAALKLTKEEKFERYWNIIEQKLIDDKESKESIEKIKQTLAKSQEDVHLDRALGAIYGAMIGDAIGAFCEFQHSMAD